MKPCIDCGKRVRGTRCLTCRLASDRLRLDATARDRFWAKVDKSGDCWLWVASRDQRGYGTVAGRPFTERKTERAYRMAYVLEVGPVPAGLELDHLCRNPSCVRPSHLEPVTHAENVRRGESGAYQRARTACPQGHPYDGKNTRWYDGRRYCKACSNARSAAWHRARKAVAA